MPGKVLEAKTFVSVLLFVSVHFLYSWLLPAVQGSKEAKGGIVKDILLCNRVERNHAREQALSLIPFLFILSTLLQSRCQYVRIIFSIL
ncbi:hypothetical protein, partial [Bilophila wadsworthia]|uniref:hypothetical protein n=1 Tax=Bilophila wadsworthia TaxID=35833 RepID=UPI00307B445A